MRVALVHDYLKEFGGAERVLEALSEIYPNAPIYTAFYTENSEAYKRFKGKDIRVSWAHYIPFFASKLHSPLRFLAPLIWGSFSPELSKYDVVISSASWYVTKGFGRRNTSTSLSASTKHETRHPIEICYCHTPPRWLYGYKTSIEWQKYWPIKVYGAIVGHFMRLYDFNAAQRVDYFIANSKEVQSRIKRFYNRDSVVIHPPVQLPISNSKFQISNKSQNTKYPSTLSSGPKGKIQNTAYYLVVARLVGGKGLDLAVKAAVKKGFNLKIVGAPAGYATEYSKLSLLASKNVEFLGFVSDDELVQLYSGAKAFLALAGDEDFGITPVEAMLCGTPVIAFYGGGYLESVVEGKTGVFFKEPTVDSLLSTIEKFDTIKFSRKEIAEYAKQFSKERFKKEIKEFINEKVH